MTTVNRWSRRFRRGVDARVRSLLLRPKPSARQRTALTLVAVLSVALICLVDAATGAGLTFGPFYLIPTVFATVTIGSTAGELVVGSAMVAGVVADLIRRGDRPLPIDLANASLRGINLMVVVALLSSLRTALDRAKASEQRSSKFLADAAHQLRTPVAGIRAAADALMLEGASRSQERLLRRVTEESARSGKLVTSLLRVARLDQGEGGPAQPCAIRELVDDEIARLLVRSPQLQFDTYVQPWIPEFVVLQPFAMQEALENVLDNACKHARHRVAVSVEADDIELRIRVTDDGTGVAVGDEARIFDRFVSLDSLGGSGLGLPIARGLAEQQGGSLRLENRTFVFTLPLIPEPPATS